MLDKLIPPGWQATIYLVAFCIQAGVSAGIVRILLARWSTTQTDVEDLKGRVRILEAAQTAGVLRDAVTSERLRAIDKNVKMVLDTLASFQALFVAELETRRQRLTGLARADAAKAEGRG